VSFFFPVLSGSSEGHNGSDCKASFLHLGICLDLGVGLEFVLVFETIDQKVSFSCCALAEVFNPAKDRPLV